MSTPEEATITQQAPVKTLTVRSIDMFQYQRGTCHTAVVIGRGRTTPPSGSVPITSSHAYRHYPAGYRHQPVRRISFSSLLRLRRALGRLFEAGRVEGYTWTCEYDETLNGHMRIKGRATQEQFIEHMFC